MKVVLTGATGPLGRRVYQALVDRHEVIPLVRPDEAASWRGPRPAQAIVEDLNTPDRYGPALRGAEVLLHLGELSQAPDARLLDVNLKGSQCLLHAFGAWGSPRQLVLLSSALVDHPAPEDPDVGADRVGSTWLATRLAVEARAALWAQRLGVPTLIVRAGHPYGAVGIDGPLSGWLDAAAASAEGDGRFALEGADTPLPFVHVDDLAQALVARVDGAPMPGERVLRPPISRVEAVGLVTSLARVHERLCRRAERVPRATPERPLRRLLAWVNLDRPLPSTPQFLRRAPLAAPPEAWVAAFGAADAELLVDALVGGAC